MGVAYDRNEYIMSRKANAFEGTTFNLFVSIFTLLLGNFVPDVDNMFIDKGLKCLPDNELHGSIECLWDGYLDTISWMFSAHANYNQYVKVHSDVALERAIYMEKKADELRLSVYGELHDVLPKYFDYNHRVYDYSDIEALCEQVDNVFKLLNESMLSLRITVRDI